MCNNSCISFSILWCCCGASLIKLFLITLCIFVIFLSLSICGTLKHKNILSTTYLPLQEAQRHFIDAELSSMLSKSYINDDSSIQYDQGQNQVS